MTTLSNPFESEPEKAAVFELGYFAGFQDPAGDDSDFLPIAPDLLDIYVEGADAGREDAHLPPAADPGKQWVERKELAEHAESIEEMQEHIETFVVFKALELITRKTVLGLVDLVITALSIQGNVSPEQFRALDDDFKASPADPPRGEVAYVPACSRTDHAMVTANVSPDGTWIGSPSSTIEEALQAAVKHEHREAYVARCDVQAKTCSAVWLAKDTQ
jgi:hypothetical protein